MRLLRLLCCLALACALAACGGGQRARYGGGSGSYAAPGPASDPWGPYIREAAERYQVPETWVRAVMRQESGGNQYLNGGLTTSSAGAIGLMQVMPATYEGLRQRYGLGEDAYDPRNNVLAGTAYIREMYDKYGSPNFLAAYNAGPRRVDDYLASGSPLPTETVNYVAAIGPRLDGGAGDSRAVYAAAAPVVVARMDPIASPGDPGMPAPALASALALAARQAADRMEPIASPGDPGVAIAEQVVRMPPIASPGDPGIPPIVAAVARAPLGTPVANLPSRPFTRAASSPTRSPPPGFLTLPATRVAAAPAPVGPAPGGYGIQVGAYASPSEARSAADTARSLTGAAGAQTAIGTAQRPDGSVLFRARLVGLSPEAATRACQQLQATRRGCFIVPPDGTS